MEHQDTKLILGCWPHLWWSNQCHRLHRNFKRRKVEKKRKFSSNSLGKSLKRKGSFLQTCLEKAWKRTDLKHQIDMAMPQDKKQLTFNCFYFVTVCSDDFFWCTLSLLTYLLISRFVLYFHMNNFLDLFWMVQVLNTYS